MEVPAPPKPFLTYSELFDWLTGIGYPGNRVRVLIENGQIKGQRHKGCKTKLYSVEQIQRDVIFNATEEKQ